MSRSKPATAIRRPRWTTGLVALAAMGVGSAATFAVTRQIRAQMADLIIAKAEARLEFANARREFFTEEFQAAEARVADGLMTPDEIEPMRLERAQVEADAAARALDVEETRISGRDPDNSLSAPTLRGRDFVSERLMVQRDVLQTRITWMGRDLSPNQQDPTDEAVASLQLDAARAHLAALDKRLALRQDYLAGARTALQVELADMQFSVKAQHETATRYVDTLQQRYDRMTSLLEAGLVSRSEAQAVELQFRAALLQRDLAELEMQILDRKLGAQSGD